MASSREMDENPDVYIGLKLPITPSETIPFFSSTTTTLEQSKSNIKNLLLTLKGERVSQPEFGSNLKKILFEPYDDSIQDKIRSEIKESVSKWLPYINISKVDVSQDAEVSNKIYVSMTYALNYSPDETTTTEISFSETGDSAGGGY
jgi:hypothetical protein